MNRESINIDDLLNKTPAPFDNDIIGISGALSYYLDLFGYSLAYRDDYIDPIKIKSVNCAIHKNWHDAFALSKCTSIVKNELILDNEFFFKTDFTITKSTHNPYYIKYKGNYYHVSGDGNHRSIVAKYFGYDFFCDLAYLA